MTRCALFLLCLSVTSCGLLFPAEPPHFREYLLKGVPYEEAVPLVYDVVHRELSWKGVGFEMTWEEDLGNLSVSPITLEGGLQLTMYIKLLPRENDTMVEMMALVNQLMPNARPGQIWAQPKQGVDFEEDLYDAFILESVDRGLVDS
jgi:hypothetical protein